MNSIYHQIGLASEMADRSARSVELDGHRIMVVRMGERYYAVENRCSHMGVSFNEGPLRGEELVCPWHSAKFCARTGQHRSGPGVCSLKTFDVRVVDGILEVAVEPYRAAHPLMGKRAAACLVAPPVAVQPQPA